MPEDKNKNSGRSTRSQDVAVGAIAAGALFAVGSLLYALFTKDREPAAPAASSSPNNSSQNNDSSTEAQTPLGVSECCVCLSEPSNCLFLPCRHLKTCMGCSQKLSLCPVCRAKIVSIEGPVYA